MRVIVMTLASVLVLAVSIGAGAADRLPASKASPLQRASDPFMGNWYGQYETTEGDEAPLCAQVIAWADGEYQANVLTAFDQRDVTLAVLKGKVTDGALSLTGKGEGGDAAGLEIRAVVKDGAFTGKFIGAYAGTLTLRKVERLSPTLGQEPPEGAVVLFDGTSLNAWERHRRNPWGIDLKSAFGGEQRVGYLRARVWSPRKQEAQLELGSDDGIKAWLNGAEIHANNASRGVAAGQDKVQVALSKGWHTLLLKITQGGGDWAACGCLRDPDGGPLTGLRVARGGAMGDDPPAESLDDTDGYIVDWQGAGPYTEAGKDGKGLFDVAFPPETGGTAEWTVLPKPVQESDECPWKLIDPGVMEVRGGGIVSKRVFRDQKVHVEFRTPFMPGSDGQGRGNSGVYLQGRYEVQVLDSFGLEGLDNECGGIYKIARPRVNMCAPPLQWQTCDITFHAARFDASGVKTADPMITVFHNGVLIHENQSISQETTAGLGGDASEPGGIHLQDHGNPVQYRNIWVLPLDR